MEIAVIGAGIAGLRAALELASEHQVTVFEKSSGVGGRVATRRYGQTAVNHGIRSFDNFNRIADDPMAEFLKEHFTFSGAATELPKAMRDIFIDFGGTVCLKSKVVRYMDDQLFLEDGSVRAFDRYIFTPPLPQVRELTQMDLLPEVTYSKAILFIGERDGTPVVEALSDEMSEMHFELSEEELRRKFPANFSDLEIKKWRYARVKTGVYTNYHQLAYHVIIAGEAFDPRGYFDLSSAWNSGRIAGSIFA